MPSASIETPDIRTLIDAFIESIPPLDPSDGRFDADQLHRLAELRETFVLAGAEALERQHNPDRWLQVGVRFADDRQRLAFLRGPLRGAARAWLSTDGATHFFYMAKPPGLRLRFGGLRPGAAFFDTLRGILDRERSAGLLEDYGPGLYEGETYQFGGQAGLEIAHDFFTYDSLAILDLLRSDDVDPETYPLLSLAVLNHLLATWCDDGWERWDAWSHLRLAHRLPHLEGVALEEALADLEAQRPALELAAFEPEALAAQLPAAPRRVLRGYFEHNERLAGRLRQATRRGALLYGFRKIFPFYVIFHWNRWLLGSDMQQTLAFFMTTLLDPKRD